MAAPSATELAWLELSDDLRRFIRRRVADDHLADDLLQETFLRIHRSIAQLTGANHLAAWVYRIARNVVHDHYRQRNDDVSLIETDPAAADEESSRLPTHVGAWLDEIVRKLPEPYREAVRLSDIDGVPQREVAERIGLSHSGAKSRVQRGRLMLKEVLEQCCVFHFDRRGNLMDCDPKPDRTVCRDCDDWQPPPPCVDA